MRIRACLFAALCALGTPVIAVSDPAVEAAPAIDVEVAARREASQAAFARAQAFGRAGDVVAAKAALREALELGYDEFLRLQWDGDLASLRSDPEWPTLLATFDRQRPWAATLRPLLDMSRPVWPTYAKVRGHAEEFEAPPMYVDFFRQYYATHALYAGDYGQAHRYYPQRTSGGADAVAAGYRTAVPATAAILARSHDRRAVFLNEAHGIATTRAVLFELVRELRRQGFDHLAMESLTGTRGEGCARTVPEDSGVQARGYATVTTGAYVRDPVYAELLRMAIAEGYTLVAYDPLDHANQAERSQGQATNLACVFERDPSARLVAIAGFANLAENTTAPADQQLGGAHFARLTGIDPLTVDLTRLLDLDESGVVRVGKGEAWIGPWLLLDGEGQELHARAFDITAFVPVASDRDQGGWLTLGGHRQPVFVGRDGCPGAVCLLQARRPGEVDDAIAADRCVVAGNEAGCRLYLPSGSFLVERLDAEGRVHSAETIKVPVADSGDP